MAFENLFIRTEKSIGGIQLDAVLSESHSNTIRTTKNPVELGADITDHSVIEPKRVTIVSEVSDTPLGTAALGEIVDLITGLFGTSTSSNITRSNAAYNAIVQLMEAREPIELHTKLKLYSNMLITDVNVQQTKDSSRVASMNITLEEILITESEIITLNADNLQEGTTRIQASSAEKRGRQEVVTPNNTTNKSVLKSVIDWVGS